MKTCTMGAVHKIVNWHTGVRATKDNRNRTFREDEQAVSNTFHSNCMPSFCFFVCSSGTSHTRIQSDLSLFSPSCTYTYAFVRSPLPVQNVQLKSGPYLVFTKQIPFVHLISTKICGEI